MNKKEKGLQKFTNSEEKYSYLFGLDYIVSKDLGILTQEELDEFRDRARDLVHSITDPMERHIKSIKFENCFDESVRNRIWENNHVVVVQKMAQLLTEYNRMPTCLEISLETGLSRTTVYKHLKELHYHELQIHQLNNFKALIPNVLTMLYKYSCHGDVSAARAFLKYVGSYEETNDKIKKTSYSTKWAEQKNFIQINNTVISQDQISTLTEEQIKQLENILSN